MVILPAVDLLGGKVVRLAQGKREAVTVYSEDPVQVARRWVEAGATWLHVVDLNGAFDGIYRNMEIARHIIEACRVNVELSGGIRTKEALGKAFEAGAARVILGTKACEDPEFVQEAADRYGHKIAVAIDARAGHVVSRGWVAASQVTARQLARSVAMLGVETIVCTDVSRDGMLQGPNLELLRDVLEVGPRSVIASGGISSLEDLRALKALEPRGVIGAIVGKALYEGTIDLKEALQVVSSQRTADS
ncbi:MAG TPA: 1-(5-phosphoribosyl)-5-[(5-phosphoribosylamino)methylideneamino]imidazole-4-carboxamide isomerase [Candidatus Omnitrophica bacterium]|nr:MAG: 1-(5-phosphoribosyl)-5-[(5-phosphoribosylamino)methylideneamino]imidazole-4-carboxamide isomerase [Omnitrophica WOR_2 bacterium GWA2_63_20]OGX19009.1 MAG: 1-(5-phosphoribosyl)-5-[(5-phosphoribosylamino)methylideneamino]imidazole-4-carboxamide isomerase [Omnitrophica WOR_2 bacterium GWF2_63_9]OGX33170.1 MAG: 1-(5-phosphoribosyl)-5-[(5-phosphoribosylamino)methylideneamino]imidazole-4-carboxamide isomerase [Omnitrophica WOR_2 bacterium RIFCSPHIGHO2_12_FULL_64_13]OGX36073.1 MAG: 1-(5-phospho